MRIVTPRRPGAASTRPGPVGDHDPAAGDVDLGHQRATNGTSASRPSGVRIVQQVLGGAVHDAGRPRRAACRRRSYAASPTSWWS